MRARDPVARLTKMLDKCCKSILEANMYLGCTPSHDQVTTTTLIQLALLEFFLVSLRETGTCMSEIDTAYAHHHHEPLDPRKTSLTESILKELITEALFCEDMQESSIGSIELVRSMLDILSESLADGLVDSRAFRSLRAEARVECSAQERMARRMVERVHSHIKFFELSRNVHDGLSLWLLTLLASIFLPLSLASGILSMQTRFADLHFLLYDFCGVITIIGSLIVVVFLALKLFTWLLDVSESLTSKYAGRSREWLRPLRRILLLNISGAALLFWALLFTSFMVGMLKEVGLGLKVLGYGCAAYFGTFLIFGICYIILTWIS